MSKRLGSRYELRERIGRGGMGEVWRGRDLDGRPVACKLLREELVDDAGMVRRFLGERTVLTGIDHPNVVRVRDMVVEGTTYGIVMDLVQGGDLRAALRRDGPMAPAAACETAAQVLDGLAAVHAAGVLHRDIKPENILLDVARIPAVARITDFGIAKLAEASTASQRSSRLIGTPAYMAPELFDEQPASVASDLYAFGCVLYEMLCGATPFQATSMSATMNGHVSRHPGRPKGVPDQVWRVVQDCLAKDPAQRSRDAAQVAAYLRALAPQLVGLPAAPAVTQPPRGPAVEAVAPTRPVPLATTRLNVTPGSPRTGYTAQVTTMDVPLPSGAVPGFGATARPVRRRPRWVVPVAVVAGLLAAVLVGSAVNRFGRSDPGAASTSPAPAALAQTAEASPGRPSATSGAAPVVSGAPAATSPKATAATGGGSAPAVSPAGQAAPTTSPAAPSAGPGDLPAGPGRAVGGRGDR